MGGGDAKLIAAASLWLGLSGLMSFLVYTAIMGGVLTLGLLALRKGLQPYMVLYPKYFPEWTQHLLKPKGDLPYGVAICAGGLMALPHSPMAYLFGLS